MSKVISNAIEDACEVLAAFADLTPTELEVGQDWLEIAMDKKFHEDEQDMKAEFAEDEGRSYVRQPFTPPKHPNARCYAMMIERFGRRREEFIAASTVEAKLAVMGVLVPEPQRLASYVAILDMSARGEFADAQQWQ